MKQYWKAYTKIPVILLVALSLLIQGCAAATLPSNMPTFETTVYAIGEGTVMHGIQSALDGMAGTGIYMNGDKFVFTWVIRNVGMAFWGVDTTNKSVFDVFSVISKGGNLSSVNNVQGIVELLKSQGWQKVSLTSVPAALQALVKGYPAIVESMGGRLTSIPLYLVLPSPMPASKDLDKWIDCALLHVCEVQS